MTGDESWCFLYDLQTKRQSAAWLNSQALRLQKVRYQKSCVKTMLIAFFDSKGLIHHEYVPFGQTVNATFYLIVLKRLVALISRLRPEYREPGSWSLLHDNAKSHTAHIIQQYFAKNQITVLNHSPYSSDFAPPNFFFISESQTGDEGNIFSGCERNSDNGVKESEGNSYRRVRA